MSSTAEFPVIGDASNNDIARNADRVAAWANEPVSFHLPAGTIKIDRPITGLRPAFRLVGNNLGTTIENVKGGPVIESFAPGLGYSAWEDIAKPVEVDDLVYLYRFSGFMAPDGLGQLCSLHRVTDAQTRAVDPPADSRIDAVQRYGRAWKVGPVKRGQRLFPNYELTGWYYLTDGPSVANSSRGEWLYLGPKYDDFMVASDPTHLAYTNALLVDIHPLIGGHIGNLTLIGHPQNTATFKGHVGLSMDNVSFGGTCNIVASAHLRASRCSGTLLLNTTSQSIIQSAPGYRLDALHLEECCHDIKILECVIGPAPYGPAIRSDASTQVERIGFEDCRIIGEVQGVGNDCTFDKVDLSGGVQSFIGGDRLSLRGVKSDSSLSITVGRDCTLMDVRCDGMLELRDGTTGQAFACRAAMLRSSDGWFGL